MLAGMGRAVWRFVTGPIGAPEVVDCSEPHRIQVTAEPPAPEGELFPTDTEWGAFQAEECEAAAADLLSGPRDPYGRLQIYLLAPTVQNWADGYRSV